MSSPITLNQLAERIAEIAFEAWNERLNPDYVEVFFNATSDDTEGLRKALKMIAVTLTQNLSLSDPRMSVEISENEDDKWPYKVQIYRNEEEPLDWTCVFSSDAGGDKPIVDTLSDEYDAE
jgi:hypothetical protein